MGRIYITWFYRENKLWNSKYKKEFEVNFSLCKFWNRISSEINGYICQWRIELNSASWIKLEKQKIQVITLFPQILYMLQIYIYRMVSIVWLIYAWWLEIETLKRYQDGEDFYSLFIFSSLRWYCVTVT